MVCPWLQPCAVLPEDDSPPLLSSSSLLLALALPAAAGWCHHPPRWPNFSLCILIAASNRRCCSSVRETPSSESACSCSELLQPSPCRMTAESHVCTAAITALWAAQRSSTAWAAQTAAIVPLVASILRRCGAPAMDLCYTNQTKHTSQRLVWRAARPQGPSAGPVASLPRDQGRPLSFVHHRRPRLCAASKQACERLPRQHETAAACGVSATNRQGGWVGLVYIGHAPPVWGCPGPAARPTSACSAEQRARPATAAAAATVFRRWPPFRETVSRNGGHRRRRVGYWTRPTG